MAEHSRRRSSLGRDCGAIPDIADPERREACLRDLRIFGETYNADAFSLGWSDDHLRAIDRIEEVVLLSALYAFAMPRGSGKTTICRVGALWASSHSHRRYPFVIGANAQKAEDNLDAVKTFIRFLPLFGEDFPEIAWPVRHLAGIANRAAGQTCQGEPTMIEWSKDRVVFPTVPPPSNWPKHWPLRGDGMVPTSGIVIGSSGLTGDGIRGSLTTLTTGELLRPDLVFLDDPQTDESARSAAQNTARFQLVNGAVLGMAGPGKSIAAVMPCTVIARGDFIDQTLDRKRCPIWRGERTKMLRTMPKNMEAWHKYFEVYRTCTLKEPPDYTEANAYYRAHQRELEAGAEASWEARKGEQELTAIQHAMHLYFDRGLVVFSAEFQNEPIGEDASAGRRELSADAVAGRLTRVERGTAPREATRLTAFLDCAPGLLWWLVVGWDEVFGGSILDYGAWPKQGLSYVVQAKANPTLRAHYPGTDEDSALYAGLKDLTAWVLGRRYHRHGTGEPMAVDMALIDAGWKPDVVFRFCRESPFAATLRPSIGRAASPTQRPVDSWKPKPGESRGPGWRLGTDQNTPGRGARVIFDADQWKSFVVDRCLTPPGGRGCLMLPGSEPAEHRMLADHLAAEWGEMKPAGGITIEKWTLRPNRDNHLFDCLVGSAVAASVRGLVWMPAGSKGPPPPRKREKLSEIQARKRAERGAAYGRGMTDEGGL